MSQQVTANTAYLSRVTSFANSDPTTIALWLRFDAINIGSRYTVWDHGNLSAFSPQLLSDHGQLVIYTSSTDQISLGAASSGLWFWVAAVFDGTAKPAVGYVGLGATLTKVTGPSNFGGFTGTVLTVFNQLQHNQNQNGKQAGLKIWNGVGGALSDKEIGNEYRRYIPSKTSSLHMWIPQLNGADAGRDNSGNGRNMTATGAMLTSHVSPPIPWNG